MQTPLQITLHQLPPTPALEAEIRAWADELDEVFDGIVSGRVSVEAPHRHHQHGQRYRVLIELGIPGDRIVVARSPDEDGAHVDAHVAVRDAFRAARRQLEDFARRLHGQVKTHAPAPQGRATQS